MITFTIPLKTTNPLNGAQGRSRGAVFAKAARRKKEREAAKLCAMVAGCCNTLTMPSVNVPAVVKSRVVNLVGEVTITRLSSGKLDGDGLQAALKSVRDGIADALGINDGSDAVIWKYEQKKCKRGTFGVEVTIT